jgi:hypothetical protein
MVNKHSHVEIFWARGRDLIKSWIKTNFKFDANLDLRELL